MFQLRNYSIILLLTVNGLGALFGGGMLIADPSGQSLGLPLTFLDHSPFTSYLVPGIVLLTGNGVGSLVTWWLYRRHHRRRFVAVMLQGFFLIAWIALQLIMIRQFFPALHLTFLAIGIALVGLGLTGRKATRW